MSYKSSSLENSINLSYTLTRIHKNCCYLLIIIFKCPLYTKVYIINIINTTQTSFFLLMSSPRGRYEILSAFSSSTSQCSDMAEEDWTDGQDGQWFKCIGRRSKCFIWLSDRVELIVATSCYASPCNLSCYQKRSTIRVFLCTSWHSYWFCRQCRPMVKCPHTAAET